MDDEFLREQLKNISRDIGLLFVAMLVALFATGLLIDYKFFRINKRLDAMQCIGR